MRRQMRCFQGLGLKHAPHRTNQERPPAEDLCKLRFAV
jgi:hypothetical protein